MNSCAWAARAASITSLVAGVGGAVADVVPHRPGEEDRLLRDDGDPGEERLLRKAADIDPVDEDPPGGDVVETGDEVHQRRFSGARRPEEGHGLARLDGQVDPLQDVFGVRPVVVEGDVFKDEPPPRRLGQGDRVRGVPHVRARSSRTSLIRRAETFPPAQMFERIVIMMSGVIVVRR